MRQVFLHYVGKQTYTPSSFRKEAIKWGVSRAVPIPFLKIIRKEDIVLLATHIHNKRSGRYGRKYAKVWGAFLVTGVNLPAFLAQMLKEMGLIKYVEDNTLPPIIPRGCGVMYIEGTFEVEEEYDLNDIFDAIVKLWEEGRIPKGTKLFLTGPYIDLPEFIIPRQEFHRGYAKVENITAYAREDAVERIKKIPFRQVNLIFNDDKYIRFSTKKQRKEYYSGGKHEKT